jgi:pimeloyl-ACP methyl ester carboxylesterase
MGNVPSSLIEKSIFPPRPRRENVKDDEENLFLQIVNTNPSIRATVACFHGNMESAAHATKIWSFLEASTLFGFEYPGFGERGAEEPSQAALLADIPDIVAALKSSERVVVCGRSLGTFAALQLAINLGDKCVGVVLVSPMLTAIATKIPSPWYRAFAFMDLLDNETAAKMVPANLPVLIVHGGKDNGVPLWNAQELLKTLPSANSSIEVFTECSHNDIMGTDRFKELVRTSVNLWLD